MLLSICSEPTLVCPHQIAGGVPDFTPQLILGYRLFEDVGQVAFAPDHSCSVHTLVEDMPSRADKRLADPHFSVGWSLPYDADFAAGVALLEGASHLRPTHKPVLGTHKRLYSYLACVEAQLQYERVLAKPYS